MQKFRILLVDDELPNLVSLARILGPSGAGYDVETFLKPDLALERLRAGGVDLVLTDMRMAGMTGLELLEVGKLLDPTVEFVLLTAYGTVDLAVEAMKKGASDFITKPLQKAQVLRCIDQALKRRQLIVENENLKANLEVQAVDNYRELVGNSPIFRSVLETAKQAAKSSVSVLIEGESGTGKGVVAEWIHRMGACSQKTFVKINCAAIPEALLEAELFGYEPGAFTGAVRRKKGRVELAEGGTLFLDEIGTTPVTLQSKLLRFLQDAEFERLGGIETRQIVTRVIAASNENLKESIKQGRFREDLYYRLNVLHLSLPALRDRAEDIPLLAHYFLGLAAERHHRETPLLSADALDCLQSYRWPGNIRELQNVMERLIVLNQNTVITADDLPSEMAGMRAERSVVVPIGLSLKQVEKILLSATLKSTQGDKRLAARLLGVHPRTIYRHLEEETLEAPASNVEAASTEEQKVT